MARQGDDGCALFTDWQPRTERGERVKHRTAMVGGSFLAACEPGAGAGRVHAWGAPSGKSAGCTDYGTAHERSRRSGRQDGRTGGRLRSGPVSRPAFPGKASINWPRAVETDMAFTVDREEAVRFGLFDRPSERHSLKHHRLDPNFVAVEGAGVGPLDGLSYPIKTLIGRTEIPGLEDGINQQGLSVEESRQDPARVPGKAGAARRYRPQLATFEDRLRGQIAEVWFGVALTERSEIMNNESGEHFVGRGSLFVVQSVKSSEGEMNLADQGAFGFTESGAFGSSGLYQAVRKSAPFNFCRQQTQLHFVLLRDAVLLCVHVKKNPLAARKRKRNSGLSSLVSICGGPGE